MEETQAYNVLARAISEVGYWRWWTAKLPKAILLEFGGVQLYSRATRDDQPPAGVMALTFRKPKSICFLDFSKDLDGTWCNQLQDDEIDPFNLDKKMLAFNDEEMITQLLKKSLRVNTLHGYAPQRGRLPETEVNMAFSAGKVGVLVAAESMELNTHQGKLALDQVESSHNKWWDYWKNYWQAKESDSPMPKDYACESTKPEQVTS